MNCTHARTQNARKRPETDRNDNCSCLKALFARIGTKLDQTGLKKVIWCLKVPFEIRSLAVDMFEF